MYSDELICQILEFIDNNLTNKIDIKQISNFFAYNRYYLMKKFKKEIGVSIINYINYQRIYNSLEEIKNNEKILKVAIDNGFYSTEYFSETFKNIMKVNPRTYQKYISKNRFISEDDVNNIINNSLFLMNLNNKKRIYLSKRKPSITPVRKLSIFK